MSARSVIRIPLLRAGKIYESLDHADIVDPARGVVVARLSQANPALIRREVEALALAAPLADFGAGTLAEMCKKAATIYANDALPVDGQGNNLSTEAWIRLQSRTTGLPENLCRRTVQRLSAALAATPEIVEGLTRRLPAEAWDRNLSGVSKGRGPLVSYHSVARHLGVVLPNNSPAVNALWLPAIAFKVPVAIKPGSQDPWTAWRLIQALVRAGVPQEAFAYLPGGHDAAASLLGCCDRGLLFGGAGTVAGMADPARVQVHGPGYSKILIGEDEIDHFEEYLDILVDSICRGGGRSCVNASTLVVPRRAGELAEALARKLVEMEVLPLDHPEACLAGFSNGALAAGIDADIEAGLREEGARDITRELDGRERLVCERGWTFLRPTVVLAHAAHPLARREFLFPFCSVVEIPQAKMLDEIGPTLAASIITRDSDFLGRCLAHPGIDRLNLGRVATPDVAWDQPHEGNLFELLHRRRAVACESTGLLQGLGR